MLLVCDIGNTRIKSAIFIKDKIFGKKITTSVNDSIDFFKSKDITAAAFSSVVPEKSEEFSDLVRQQFNISPLMISDNLIFNLKIDYSTPENLGTDRVCSAEGAFYLFKRSNKYRNYGNNDFIVSIDLGTATTINFVKYPGTFIGGIIAPGVEMMSESLHNKTALLPVIPTSEYKKLIGKNTKESIASGVINSTVGLIEKSFSQLKSKRKPENIHIYLTGGNAQKIIPYLKIKHKFVEELVLLGIKAIYEKNAEFKI
jgi:type III pantothenate kinase